MSNIRIFAVVFPLLVVLTIFWYHFTYGPFIFVPTESTSQLPNVSTSTTSTDKITYSSTQITTRAHEYRTKYFHATMTANQKAGMLNLMKIFKQQMEKYNITYFLYGGSLLGVYRHHGFIPWDDDIDILIDSNKKEELKEALKELNTTHNLKYYGGKDTNKWKFYKLDGQKYSHKPFRYPYLDLFFFKEYSDTKFYVEVERELMLKNDVFPLVDKMFEGIVLPTPCNTESVLKVSYKNLNKCSSPSWNHSTEYGVSSSKQVTIDCDLLKPYFPFVERRIEKLSDRNYVLEILKLDKTVIQIVTYSSPLVCSMNYSRYPSNAFITKV